jgi:hypothetical protein
MTKKFQFDYTDVPELRVLKNTIIVRDMNFEHRVTTAGIYLPGDDGKSSGIRPRWARVFRTGPETTTVSEGQYVLIEHGRWTRGLKIRINDEEIVIRKIDPKAIIFVSDQPHDDETISDKAV